MKKVLSVFLCLTLLVSMVPLAFAQEEKTTLSIMYWDATDEKENDDFYWWVMHTYENWEKKDQVALEMLPQTGSSNDMFTKANLMMQSEETSPDIYMDDSFQAVADSAAGYLMDLSDVLAGWNSWNNGSFYEAAKSMVIGEDGGVYGIPFETDARGLWVNTQVLADAGLGAEWAPKSWEELLTGLRQIKAQLPDVIPIWYKPIANSEGTTVNNLLLFLMGTPDGLYDWEAGKWNVKSQGLLDTFTFYETTVKEGLTGTLSELVSSSTESYAYQYLRDGKLGMFVGGSWVAGSQFVKGASFEWEGYENVLKFIPVPTQFGQDGGYVTVSGGYALTIPEKSDAKELAAEFLMAMMDDVEGLCHRTIRNGSLACRAINEAPNYNEYTSRPYVELATSFLEWTKYRPQIGAYSTVSSCLSTALEMVVTGTSPKDAMNDLARDVANAIGEENTQSLIE